MERARGYRALARELGFRGTAVVDERAQDRRLGLAVGAEDDHHPDAMDAHADAVRAPIVGKHVMRIPIVVRPA